MGARWHREDEIRAWLLEHLGELSAAVLEALASEVEGYDTLPASLRETDVAAMVRHNLELAALSLGRGDAPSADELALVRDSAARRAEEGVPLELTIDCYLVGARTVWRRILERFELAADEHGAPVERALSGLQGALRAVASSYGEELRFRALERAWADPAMLSLAAASDPSSRPPLRSVDLGEAEHLVASVRFTDLDGPEGLSLQIRQRRRAREASARIERLLPERANWHMGTSGARLITRLGAEEAPERLAHDAADALRTVLGDDLRVAWTTAGASEIGEAISVTDALQRTAASRSLPQRVVGVDDLALELQLDAVTAGTHALAEILEPLVERPGLMQTLEVHLRSDMQRKVTARLLSLHPNTVDYRLARIAELTGLDLSTPRASAILLASLAARRTLQHR